LKKVGGEHINAMKDAVDDGINVARDGINVAVDGINNAVDNVNDLVNIKI